MARKGIRLKLGPAPFQISDMDILVRVWRAWSNYRLVCNGSNGERSIETPNDGTDKRLTFGSPRQSAPEWLAQLDSELRRIEKNIWNEIGVARILTLPAIE